MRLEKNSQPTAGEVLQAIEDFALSSQKEIEAQTTEDLELFLQESAVTIEPSNDDIKEQLAAARNRIALSAASEERLRHEKDPTWAQAARSMALAGKALRDEVSRRLDSLNPKTSAMFARDFQEGDDDDLRTMLTALNRLEADEGVKGEQDV